MGIFSSKVDFKFVEDSQKQLSQLDNSLASLASSVDAIHGTVALLLQQLEEECERDGNNKDHHARSIHVSLTRNLLSSVEGSLYHEKMAFVQGISQFIHLLTNKSDNKQFTMKHMPTLQRLNVDKYIADFQKKQKAAFNEALRQKSIPVTDSAEVSVDLEKNKILQDMQQRIEQLQKEKDSLEFIATDLTAEKDKYRVADETFKQEIERILVENNTMSETINMLKEENDTLTKDLEKAQRRIEIVPVQICRQRRGELMEMIEGELVTMLNDHLRSENVELAIKKCETTSDIRENEPLLILCISTSRLGTDAKNAIQGVLQLGYTALLIFHHKDQHALPSQSSDRVLAGPEFKELCGIFDLAFLTGKGLYTCEMNTHAIACIVDFVHKVSKENGLMKAI